MTFRFDRVILLSLVLLGEGCESPTEGDRQIALPQKVSVSGYFSFNLPEDMKGSYGYGVDSYGAWYESKGARLWMDFGVMTTSLGSFRSDHKNTYSDTISHRSCEIAVGSGREASYPDSTRPYFAEICFPRVSDVQTGWTLIMGFNASSEAGLDTAMAVFQSIIFTMP